MNLFANRKQALEATYVVMIPPSKPYNPVRILTGVTDKVLKQYKEKHPDLVVFKKEEW
ncbi:hypothetical protein [Aeromonas phage Akh-2]|nr:hypothetical protein [Aeromonas phage Akh-2]